MESAKGIGVDIVAIDKLKKMLESHPQASASIFTELENSYCQAARNWAERYAARYAAKEAVLKALGTGMAKGMSWQDIEVYNLPTGQPRLKLYGEVARKAALLGINAWLISLTHSREIAVACVAGQSAEIGGLVLPESPADVGIPDEGWFM